MIIFSYIQAKLTKQLPKLSIDNSEIMEYASVSLYQTYTF